MSRRILLTAPVLLLATLAAWALASPVGASPDEDYHLVSVWCATGDAAHCEFAQGGSEATVPGALVDAACYAFDSDQSASCQNALDFTGSPDTTSERGNFYGAYPPVFYGVMSLFVGGDIEVSVLLMRLFIALVFTAIASALFLLLPPERRGTLVWSWTLTTVPLGLFVVTALNPSAWAIAGVGFGWLALAGFFEARGLRKIGLGVVFALAVVMAAGSRGDASLYMVLAILATVILQFRRSRAFALDAILPAAGIAVCLLLFRVSRPTEALTQGVHENAGFAFGRLIPTMLDVPKLWMGVFGKGWGLGWLDTTMPSLVWLATLSCFLGAGAVAAARADARKIVVLFAGVLFWEPPGRRIRFGRVQRLLVIAALAIAQAVALFLQLSRYVSGFDDLGPDLDAHIEWWWHLAISPMTVWVIGSLAYTGLIALLLARTFSEGEPSPAVADSVDGRLAEAKAS